MIRIYPLLLALILTHFLHAQDTAFARMHVNKLAADDMHGRGYVNSGDKIAAQYIESQFKKLKLKSFGDGYVQEFDIAVNTFSGAYEFSAGKKKLKISDEFLILPFAGGAFEGTFGIVRFDDIKGEKDGEMLANMMTSGVNDKFLVLPAEKRSILYKLKKNNMVPKGVVLLEENRLMHGYDQLNNFPVVRVKADAFPQKAKKVTIKANCYHWDKYTTQNVIGYVKGAKAPKKYVVFSAHYDHLGTLGPTAIFNGANDNASGTSMLIDLARHYRENPPEYSVVFIAFGAEEVKLLGSRHFTRNPLFPLKDIQFVLNMDIMGTGDEGIGLVNATSHPEATERLVALNKEKGYLPKIKTRGPTTNSDHHWFHEAGVPAFFIYTMGGIAAYHDVHDRPETLPLTKYSEVFQLLTGFVEGL